MSAKVGIVGCGNIGEDAPECREMPLSSEFVGNWRGLGVADMALTLRDGRPHRANGDLA